MNKKGVSPLLAVLVIMVIAFLLGILFTYVFKTKPLQPFSCEQDLTLQIKEVDGEKQICLDGSLLYFVLENRGQVTIEGYRILVVGETLDTVDTIDKVPTQIRVRELEEDRVDILPIVGKIKRVEFKPYLWDEETHEVFLCQRSVLMVYHIKSCNTLNNESQ